MRAFYQPGSQRLACGHSQTDVQASISELGPAFRPNMAHFLQHSGYLKADTAKVAELKARYAALPGQVPLIGVSWQSCNESARRSKSVALDQWEPILNTPGVRFVSLQYGDVAKTLLPVAQALSSTTRLTLLPTWTSSPPKRQPWTW